MTTLSGSTARMAAMIAAQDPAAMPAIIADIEAAAAPCGSVALVSKRIVNDTNQNLLTACQRYGNRVNRVAVDIIRRPVQGVGDPNELFRAIYEIMVSSFFTEKLMIGVSVRN